MGQEKITAPQPDPAAELNNLLASAGATPKETPVSTVQKSTQDIKLRVDASLLTTTPKSTQQTTDTSRVAIPAIVESKAAFIREHKDLGTNLSNNYQRLSDVQVQPRNGEGIQLTATIRASAVQINPATQKPELIGGKLRTVDENGYLMKNFNLKSTTITPKGDGDFILTQNFERKEPANIFERSTYGLDYTLNPPREQQGLNFSVMLNLSGGKKTITPGIGYNGVRGTMEIPLDGPPKSEPTDIKKVHTTILAPSGVNQNQSVKNNTAQTQPENKSGMPAPATVKTKGVNLQ